MRDIMQTGEDRPDRTGVGTRAVFARQLRFDLTGGRVPFTTTKRLAWKTVLKELLWMLRGETDSKVLEAQGVGIWSGNTSRAFLDARGLSDYPEGETGPLYGAALRKYRDGQVDQLSNVVAGIITDPFSRRHILTTYDPSVVDRCVLMPCHGICVQYHCTGDDSLSCHVYCRSSDVFLGLGFNIASYAMLLHIIAKKTGRRPLELIVSTGDTHIYANHFDQVQEQLSREALAAPVLLVSDAVGGKAWEDIAVADFDLVGYVCHPQIRAPVAV